MIEEFGTPDVFRPAELDEPTPGPGQVAVQQQASSVNPVDYKIRQGAAGGIAERAAKKGTRRKSTRKNAS